MTPDSPTGRPQECDPRDARGLRAYFVRATVDDPAVAPGGSHVAYLDHGVGRPELCVTDGTDVTRLTDGELRGAPARGTDYRWIADGDGLLVVAMPGDDPDRATVYRVDLDGSWTRIGDVGCVVSLVTDLADGGVLYVDNVTTGTPPGRLCRLSPDGSTTVVDDDVWVRGGRLSPTGDDVALRVHRPNRTPTRDVHLATRDGTDRRRVGVDGDWVVDAWGPDADRMLGRRPGDGLVTVTPDGQVESLDETSDCRGVGYRPDGTPLVRETDSGAVRTPGGDPILSEATAAHARGGTLAAVRETDDRVVLDVDGDTVVDRTRQVTDPPASEVAVHCPDGEERTGLLYEPEENTGRAVVWTYTLPEAAYAPPLFAPARSLLVDHGFAVLHPGNRGHGGSEAAEADVAAAGRWLRDRGYEDLVVVGHSSGGTDACLQATWHPDVWDAAVAWNPVTDLLAQDEYEGGRENLFRGTLGDPAGNADRWRACSPVTHAADLGTPLLLLHSENDTRVPVEQSESMAEAFDAAGFERGADYEFTVVPDEWHATRDADARAHRWRLILEFVEGRLDDDES